MERTLPSSESSPVTIAPLQIPRESAPAFRLKKRSHSD
jgi:hypothetical protein